MTEEGEQMAAAEEEEQVAAVEPFVPEFKLLLIGHKGVGQKQFLTRFGVGSETEGRPQVVLHTNLGAAKFKVWDSNEEEGQGEEAGSLNDEYCQGARCAIIIFDVTDKETYKHVPKWHAAVARAGRNIPVALCASNSKQDEEGRQQARRNFHRKMYLNYFEFTLEECGEARFLDIFLWFSRKLSGNNQLHFVLSSFALLLMLVDALCTRERVANRGVSDAELRVLSILADETHTQHREVSLMLAEHHYQNPLVGVDAAIPTL